jgi:peptide deformylase
MSIFPIVTYNDDVLRAQAKPIESDSPELQKLIDDMFETMYNGHGVGLAAPQIGKSLRLFVVDADPMYEDEENPTLIGKQVFINPEIISSGADKIAYDEGCLSIPGIRESVSRPDEITVKFLDRNFKEHTATYTGWLSRVFQHEFDHLNGVLFIDYLGSFRKRLLKSKLDLVLNGEMDAEYPLKPKK